MHHKQPNYFQMLNIKRVYTSQEIRSAYKNLLIKYHPDKNQDNPAAEQAFVQVKTIHKLFTENTKYRMMYDVLGDQETIHDLTEYAEGMEEAASIAAIAKSVLFYFVISIILSVVTYDYRGTSLRKYIFAFIIINSIFDIWVFKVKYKNCDQKDIFDDIFPRLTFFERLQLQKILISPIITILIINYKLFHPELSYEKINQFCTDSKEMLNIAQKNKFNIQETQDVLQKMIGYFNGASIFFMKEFEKVQKINQNQKKFFKLFILLFICLGVLQLLNF